MEPHAYVDMRSERFRELAQALNASHDDFIRTTEERHRRAATKLWNRLVAAGEIYQGQGGPGTRWKRLGPGSEGWEGIQPAALLGLSRNLSAPRPPPQASCLRCSLEVGYTGAFPPEQHWQGPVRGVVQRAGRSVLRRVGVGRWQGPYRCGSGLLQWLTGSEVVIGIWEEVSDVRNSRQEFYSGFFLWAIRSWRFSPFCEICDMIF